MITTKIQQELTDLVEEELQKLHLPEKPFSLYEPVRYTLSLGGKRVRPYFTLVACGMSGGDPREAMPAAMAIELLHNFTLLHDDIMDAADTRRGKDSVYKKWDTSTAILSGDAMYAWAFEQLQYYGSKDAYGKEQYEQIISIFLSCARLVCEGQAYDLEFQDRDNVTIEEYLNMIRGKTGALISGSFRLGGAVAGAGSREIEELGLIGNEVGTAFQIQDDLLDVIAEPSKFGKKKGGDIEERKKTYLSILSLQLAENEEAEYLHSIFNNKNEIIRPEEIDKVISLYDSLGIIEKTSAAVEHHYNNALQHLDSLTESEYKEDLEGFLSNLINREY